jgi:hypothetical protein
MVDFDKERRRVVSAGGMAGAGLILAGTTPRILWAAEKHDEDKEKEVGAVEDLMREKKLEETHIFPMAARSISIATASLTMPSIA